MEKIIKITVIGLGSVVLGKIMESLGKGDLAMLITVTGLCISAGYAFGEVKTVIETVKSIQ